MSESEELNLLRSFSISNYSQDIRFPEHLAFVPNLNPEYFSFFPTDQGGTIKLEIWDLREEEVILTLESSNVTLLLKSAEMVIALVATTGISLPLLSVDVPLNFLQRGGMVDDE